MALVALVGLVVGVREQVSFQIGTLVEASLAHRALVRRFLKTKFFLTDFTYRYSYLLQSITKRLQTSM